MVEAQSTDVDSPSQIKMKQPEILGQLRYQDLINAAYNTADSLGIPPWVLIRANGWGLFVDSHESLYEGDHIIDIEGISIEQNQALIDEILGSEGKWDQLLTLIE